MLALSAEPQPRDCPRDEGEQCPHGDGPGEFDDWGCARPMPAGCVPHLVLGGTANAREIRECPARLIREHRRVVRDAIGLWNLGESAAMALPAPTERGMSILRLVRIVQAFNGRYEGERRAEEARARAEAARPRR